MNRQQRRALARIHRRTHAAERRKQSHRLAPQVCALWCPSMRMYVAHFEPGRVRYIDHASLALHLDEDEAARAAITLHDMLGLRVQVRPVPNQPFTLESLAQ